MMTNDQLVFAQIIMLANRSVLRDGQMTPADVADFLAIVENAKTALRADPAFARVPQHDQGTSNDPFAIAR